MATTRSLQCISCSSLLPSLLRSCTELRPGTDLRPDTDQRSAADTDLRSGTELRAGTDSCDAECRAQAQKDVTAMLASLRRKGTAYLLLGVPARALNAAEQIIRTQFNWPYGHLMKADALLALNKVPLLSHPPAAPLGRCSALLTCRPSGTRPYLATSCTRGSLPGRSAAALHCPDPLGKTYDHVLSRAGTLPAHGSVALPPGDNLPPPRLAPKRIGLSLRDRDKEREA